MTDHGVVIGRILSPHGTGGMVKVYPYSDFPERVYLLKEVELETQDAFNNYKVEKASLHGNYWLVKFQGIDTREEANSLGGSLVWIPKENRMPLPEGTFYHDQLVGLQVYSIEGELLGSITDVIKNGGHDQLILTRSGQKDKRNFIPAVKEFITQVDLSAGFMVVSLPDGMLDL